MIKRIISSLIISLICILYSECVQAQSVKDSIAKKRIPSDKSKIWVSGAGFPYYKPTTSAGLGGSAIISFRPNKSDSLSFRSYVPLNLLVSIRGQVEFSSGLNLFYNKNKCKLRLDFDVDWGIANYFGHFSNIKEPDIADPSTHYTQLSIDIKALALYSVAENLHLGPYMSIDYKQLSNIHYDVFQDLKELRYTTPNIINLGVGALIEYSSIDNPTFPYKGIAANMRLNYNYEFLSTKANTFGIWLDYRQYLKLFNRRSVLAWRAYTDNVINNQSELFLLNPSLKVRSILDKYYYAPSLGALTLEYRHMIGSDKNYETGAFWTRLGFTAWGNIGAFGDELFKWTEVVYSVGLGLRFEVQPHKNVRFDIGQQIGGSNAISFYIGFIEEF